MVTTRSSSSRLQPSDKALGKRKFVPDDDEDNGNKDEGPRRKKRKGRVGEVEGRMCNFCAYDPVGKEMAKTRRCDWEDSNGYYIECSNCNEYRAGNPNSTHTCSIPYVSYTYKKYHTSDPAAWPVQVCDSCAENGSLKSCDVDPWLGIACSNCKSSSKNKPTCKVANKDMAERPKVLLGAKKWFRHACDTCTNGPRTRPTKCSWLENRTRWNTACNICSGGNEACIGNGEMIQAPQVLELPTSWTYSRRLKSGHAEPSNTTPWRQKCRGCEEHVANCRVSTKYPFHSCTRCTSLGIDCESVDGTIIYPLFDLSRVGFGAFMPFRACARCLETGRNCDRQRPCDSCVDHGDHGRCDDYMTGQRRRVVANAGTTKRSLRKPGPLYYLAHGYGPGGVNDVKDGTSLLDWIGPPCPIYGLPVYNGKTVGKHHTMVMNYRNYAVPRDNADGGPAPPHGGPQGSLANAVLRDLTKEDLANVMKTSWPGARPMAECLDFHQVSKEYKIRAGLIQDESQSPLPGDEDEDGDEGDGDEDDGDGDGAGGEGAGENDDHNPLALVRVDAGGDVGAGVEQGGVDPPRAVDLDGDVFMDLNLDVVDPNLRALAGPNLDFNLEYLGFGGHGADPAGLLGNQHAQIPMADVASGAAGFRPWTFPRNRAEVNSPSQYLAHNDAPVADPNPDIDFDAFIDFGDPDINRGLLPEAGAVPSPRADEPPSPRPAPALADEPFNPFIGLYVEPSGEPAKLPRSTRPSRWKRFNRLEGLDLGRWHPISIPSQSPTRIFSQVGHQTIPDVPARDVLADITLADPAGNANANEAGSCMEPTHGPRGICGKPTYGRVECRSSTHVDHVLGYDYIVCHDCNVDSVKALVDPEGDPLMPKDLTSLRAYLCESCAAGVRATPANACVSGAARVWGGNPFADQRTPQGTYPAHIFGRNIEFQRVAAPATGCGCAYKLLGRPLCRYHRLHYTEQAVRQAALMQEWRLNRFGKNVCPVCILVKSIPNANASDEPGPKEPAAWKCFVCSDLVINQTGGSELVPRWESWFTDLGLEVPAAWMQQIWDEDVVMSDIAE